MADNYYKHYHRDFLDGVATMELEDVGAYIIILNNIYLYDRGLADDDRYIARLLGCDVRKWRAIRKRLLDTGKLMAMSVGSPPDVRSILDNKRAIQERSDRDQRGIERRSAAHRGGIASGEARRNKGLGEASASTPRTRGEESRGEEIRERAASQPALGDYVFRGKYVQGISEDDLQAFVDGRGLPRARVLEELRKCDKWYIDNPQAQKKNWFLSVGRWLDRVDPDRKPASNVMTFREREDKAQRDALDDLRRIAK